MIHNDIKEYLVQLDKEKHKPVDYGAEYKISEEVKKILNLVSSKDSSY